MKSFKHEHLFHLNLYMSSEHTLPEIWNFFSENYQVVYIFLNHSSVAMFKACVYTVRCVNILHFNASLDIFPTTPNIKADKTAC